jgi:hypothetical protein
MSFKLPLIIQPSGCWNYIDGQWRDAPPDFGPLVQPIIDLIRYWQTFLCPRNYKNGQVINQYIFTAIPGYSA